MFKHKLLAISILIIFMFILYKIIEAHTTESFQSIEDKGNAIMNWFKNTSDHSYNNYIKNIDSDIVDYKKLEPLFKQKNLTSDDIVNNL